MILMAINKIKVQTRYGEVFIDPTYKEELDAQYDAMKKYALKEARREGKSEEKNTIAVSMKKDGVNLDIIAKYTGLSIDKIAAL